MELAHVVVGVALSFCTLVSVYTVIDAIKTRRTIKRWVKRMDDERNKRKVEHDTH